MRLNGITKGAASTEKRRGTAQMQRVSMPKGWGEKITEKECKHGRRKPRKVQLFSKPSPESQTSRVQGCRQGTAGESGPGLQQCAFTGDLHANSFWRGETGLLSECKKNGRRGTRDKYRYLKSFS